MTSMMYLGTSQGVMTLKSGDGRNWEQTAHGIREWQVTEVACVPGKPEQVFAATRGDGVWFSPDAGKTWRKPSYGRRGPGKVRCLAIDAQNPDTIYAGGEPIDLFVSHDAGRNWEAMDSLHDMPSVALVDYPAPWIEPHLRDIAIDPLDDRTVTVALQVGYMFRTTDGGATWKLLDRDVDADVHTIVVDPRLPSRMFVATGGHECRGGKVKGRALYRSLDGGASWAPTAMEFTQEYSVPLVMHPRDSAVLFSAVANSNPGDWGRPSGAESAVIRTTDGGNTWHQLVKGLEAASREFPQAIVIDEEHPDTLYMAPRSGALYASFDRGDSWTTLSAKLPEVQDIKLVRA